MNEHTRVRYGSAKRVAEHFRDKLGAIAGMVTGSVADDGCDDISDIDMAVFYKTMPSAEQIEQARFDLNGSDRLLQLGSLDEGAYLELYYVGTIKHDMCHYTFPAINEQLNEVLEKHDAASPFQKVAEGIGKGLVFFGEDAYQPLRERCLAYPEPLAEAMVRLHLKFSPPWAATRMGLDRGDFMFAQEFLFNNQKSVLGCLMGLNRIYHWGEYKRFGSLVQKLKIAPPNLYERLHTAYRNPESSEPIMDGLIRETLDLIQEHMPAIDLTGVRTRLSQAASKT